MSDEPLNCPGCGVSLLGDKIPDDIAEHYNGTYWKREIGVEDSSKYDGVYFWMCPDCKYEWGGYRGLKQGATKTKRSRPP